jgi:hypothetical protein
MKNSHLTVLDMAGSTLILLTIAAAALLWSEFPETYRRIIQEDGPVEWMTFWAFALAGGVALAAFPWKSLRQHRFQAIYLLAFGLGCLAIALEEISWGQRLVGYQPPERFLAENFQQEFNLHNLAGTATRKAMLTGLLVGFGVLFPLLGRLPPTARWLGNLGIPAPSLALVPGFAALTFFYLEYPIESTGEWVELGAGIGFLFPAAGYLAGAQLPGRLAIGILPIALGAITPFLIVPAADPTKIRIAEAETRALAADLKDRRLRTRCGVHKRLYTFIQEYGSGALNKGAWGRLEGSVKADATRRLYFLDPWNLPYWVRHVCHDGRTTAAFVYSFGPNRRRDSSRHAVRPDDIGRYAAGAPSDSDG